MLAACAAVDQGLSSRGEVAASTNGRLDGSDQRSQRPSALRLRQRRMTWVSLAAATGCGGETATAEVGSGAAASRPATHTVPADKMARIIFTTHPRHT